VNAHQGGFVAALANDRDVGSAWKKNANDRNAILDMGAEVAERVGVVPLDYRNRLSGECPHAAGLETPRIRLKRLNAQRKI
jgi:hypothetical protein